MGITGLTTFMDNSYLDEILDDIELHSCDLLIDGYSLLYRLHASASLQSTHGGNYDALHATLTDLFEKFRACQIRPIVLLDGGRDRLDRKFKTSLKRATDRLREVNSLNSTALNANNCHNSKKGKQKLTLTTKINLESLINTGNYRIFSNLLPVSSFQVYMSVLRTFSIPHYQCFFEADYDLGRN